MSSKQNTVTKNKLIDVNWCWVWHMLVFTKIRVNYYNLHKTIYVIIKITFPD